MAIIGLSLVLASVVYFAIRRPPFIQTFLALWCGHPRIDQPPNIRSSPSLGTADTQDQSHANTRTGQDVSEAPKPILASASRAVADRAAMPPPPPPPAIRMPNGTAKTTTTTAATTPPEPPTISTPSPQTTPKASATQRNGSIPSFSLSASPPPSSAAVARNANPTASSVLPSSSKPSTSSMAPPPRPGPPVLTTPNASSSLLAAPRTSGPLPNRLPTYDRQPGTSTLAPPPTHSSKPAKPSRKVTLSPGHSPLDWARLANQPTSDLRGVPPGTPYLRVTPTMLRRQTGRKGKDAWTALGGRVYNMTPYLPFHPGGEPELLRAAGRDGTRLFGEIHPWVNYETMLASCLVGLLVEEGEAESTGEMDAMD
ncbi:hypothetical protein F4810DRAFT_382932 [Camillea tinctor]|nr:hypothetical protein F4810DRAFT_382932 [Camillea tinctor]